MSMSQEEIEALMSGLDIDESENESEDTTVNTEEIEELLGQTENIDLKEDTVQKKVEEVEKSSESIESNVVNNDEIDELLKNIEENSSDVEDEVNDNFLSQDIEVPEDSIKEETLTKDDSTNDEKNNFEKIDEDEIAKSWTNNKINEGIFPLPAEQDTKVVTQLSQVANDSEEKVSQIFDVLSLSLDNNNNIRNEIKNIQTFLEEEKKLLENLTAKFPNISVFSKHLSEISKINDSIIATNNATFEEDNKIFEAMELMQFNDINRQKIERVMSVIRKLSMYLNNIFEDDGVGSEVAVARHIHGDNTQDLIGDDLDKLINEFSNKE